MSAPESPAETVRRGAEEMRKLASDATPGPWQRPLNVRNKAIVTAPLPENEPSSNWVDGINPTTGEREQCGVVMVNTWSDGRHYRKRSGRDLEYVAAMDPSVALLIADQWDAVADVMAFEERVSSASAPSAIEAKVLAAALKFLGEAR